MSKKGIAKKRLSFWSRTKQKFISFEQLINKYPLVTTIIVLIVCALLLISRRPGAIIDPQFWAEDGHIWFAQAYNMGPLHTLFMTYAGTISVMTRFIGSAATFVPFGLAPLFTNVAAMVFQLVVVYFLLSQRLRDIIPYKSLAIVLSLVFVSLPNTHEVLINLANIQWHLGVAAFLVLIARNPPTKLWLLFDIAILTMTGLTGPLGLTLLPIAGIIWLRNRSRISLLKMTLLGVTSVVQAFSLFVINAGHRVGGQPDASIFKLLKMLVGQIYLGGLMGEKFVDSLYSNTIAMVIVLILAWSLIAYALIKGPLWLRLANFYSILLIVMVLFSLKPQKGFDVWTGITYPGGGQRYWYIPIFVWLITLFWLAIKANATVVRYGSRMLVVPLVLFGFIGAWQFNSYEKLHFQDYANVFETTPIGETIEIPLNPPGWSMVLKKHP